eukprot:scaffold48796_cov49-Phaeocystis_antarctica.AAC.1
MATSRWAASSSDSSSKGVISEGDLKEVSADTILLRDCLLLKVGTNEHEQEGFEAAFAAQLRVRIYAPAHALALVPRISQVCYSSVQNKAFKSA